MRIRAALLTLALAGGLSASVASPFSDAADLLDGEWRGTDFVLRVDAKRAQASVNSAKPFEWARFTVKEVTEREVVFSVGAELYEARIDSDILVLTGTSFRGEQVLFRDAKLRGTTEN